MVYPGLWAVEPPGHPHLGNKEITVNRTDPVTPGTWGASPWIRVSIP